MSYIHEALKKAQVERDRNQGSPMGMPVSEKKLSSFTGRKIILFAAFLILLLLAFAGYSWWDSNRKKQSVSPVIKRGAVDSKRRTAPVKQNAVPRKERRKPTAPEQANRTNARASGAGEESFNQKEINESYQKARALHHDGRLLDAGKWYEKVIALDPGHVEALNNRGVLYLHHKNYSSARTVFMKAIRLKPDYVDPYYNLACVSVAVGQLNQGLRYLKKAVSMNPRVKKWAQDDPDMAPLRNTPGFNEIIEK